MRLHLLPLRGRRAAAGPRRWSSPANATHPLDPGGVRLRLRSVRGTWHVTQAGDPADHLLGPGDELVTAARGRVVAWALTAAELRVAPEGARRPAQEIDLLAPAARP